MNAKNPYYPFVDFRHSESHRRLKRRREILDTIAFLAVLFTVFFAGLVIGSGMADRALLEKEGGSVPVRCDEGGSPPGPPPFILEEKYHGKK